MLLRGARRTALTRLRVRPSRMRAAIRALRRDPRVRYAEPDYLLHESAAPNDPSFSLQWGSRNTGQLVNGVSGTAGADDRALAAWGVATGTPAVVIGEADSGVDYNHPDLAANVWSNPGGVGGCPAGTHGENIVAQTCDPMDDETQYGGHGTHVAGILGAVGNNGRGVAGMNWSTSILPVKWLDASGSGSTSQLIAALDWLIRARQAGVNVRVVNESATFVGTAYSQALADEIDLLAANDILFVTAAGNTGDDNDDPARRRYPCGYDRPNEICVTASDSSDQLPSWANYGATTVDLAAPGDNIYSTLRNGAYGFVSGGSMASPQVAGAAALILSQGYRSAGALRSTLLDNVDPLPSLAGRVRTGGRLDVCRALTGCATPPPTATFGTTSVGAAADVMNADRKRVNPYSLTTSGTVSRLTAYLEPTQTAGQQLVKGVLYADAGGAPGRLLARLERAHLPQHGPGGLVRPAPHHAARPGPGPILDRAHQRQHRSGCRLPVVERRREPRLRRELLRVGAQRSVRLRDDRRRADVDLRHLHAGHGDGPGERRAANGVGHSADGPDAHGVERVLVGNADGLRLRVAPLRRDGGGVRGDRGRDGTALRGRGR